MVTFRASYRQNNQKSTFWQFKTDDFVKFRQTLPEINIFATIDIFLPFRQFFRQKKEILWSLLLTNTAS